MPTYIALLRGINVGNNMLKMDRVREIWEDLGFTNTRTYIQSGNVVFDAKGSLGTWAKRIDKALTGETRLPVTVFIRTATDIDRIAKANPFLKGASVDARTLHVTFLERAPTKAEMQKLSAIDSGDDRIHNVGVELYLHCPNGYGRTKLSNPAIEKALAMRTTTRNWNTVMKLREMAGPT